MSEPNHYKGNIWKGAIFSPCEKYRYCLWRRWDIRKRSAMFIGLNPSTADETEDDPTVRRCIRFAKDWGCGGLVMMNAFAYRATDPKVMKNHPEPIGPQNDYWLSTKAASDKTSIIVAAWGTHGAHLGRGAAVLELLPTVHHLGLTRGGFPKHPLYLRADTQPKLFEKTVKEPKVNANNS